MTDNLLQLAGKKILVFGVANRRSVAYYIGRVLSRCGAECIYSVKDASILEQVKPLLPDAEIYTCDVRQEEQIEKLAESVRTRHGKVYGLVHSIAFARYEPGQTFLDVPRDAFLEAVDISCYSLIAIARHFATLLEQDGAVVTISISTTRMAAENYGMMAPVKAALDSTVAFLAKSFSRFSRIRVNAVGAGLLKTSASAAIPGYADAYLYAEQVIPRKEPLRTEEVANVAAFLLSPLSSGINAQVIVVDAGMSINYFDQEIIRRVLSASN